MKNLSKLLLPAALTTFISVTALAGETHTPPCSPGEIQSPPCSSQPVYNDSTTPGELTSPPASNTTDLIDLAETVIWSLLLF